MSFLEFISYLWIIRLVNIIKMVSKSCKYAIRAAVFIASRANAEERFGVKEIAAEIEAPPAFTAKILRTLSKYKIITSLKGPYGGFYCEKYQLDLAVSEIVNAMDGMSVFKECVMGLHQCSDAHPCPMHYKYAGTRNELMKTFQETSVGSLAADLSKGSVFIKNEVL
ncbi:RrF2 family transcriptional regulator [Salinimicrobium sediminilitoris]|uniref:RrF2 family transcriptional regulator n=1 Tax=Salinimicrobium sediminilitoris TaxID=2876715 RepID=UPI001E2E3EDA|nr:Rrf2 family transcriptional regulator [Salinimicrobium sediminilitoris]MCC8358330.1 Rrf2 family transcriptional regulator [Salinimicrobium sediminilitoris]